jgi:putative ABC transport system substrate-binding protein
LADPSSPIAIRFTEAFRRGLREFGGFVEGQNLAIEYRYGDLDGLHSAATDLVRLKADVIVAGGTPAALATKRATNTIPIVGVAMADPIADQSDCVSVSI